MESHHWAFKQDYTSIGGEMNPLIMFVTFIWIVGWFYIALYL